MKIENLERASQINDELAKLKLAKETLNNGGYAVSTAAPGQVPDAWNWI